MTLIGRRLQKLRMIAAMLSDRRFLRNAFRWQPRSLTAYTILRRLERHIEPPQTIIDGGANVGQFARAAIEFFPAAVIYAFEPLPDVANKLRENLSDSDNVQVIQTAIGNVAGSISFYKNEYDQASSALQLVDGATDNHPKLSAEVTEVTVPVVTLDEFTSQLELQGPILIKLDLQGFELRALMGARRTLERTDYVLVESAVVQSYIDEPTDAVVTSYLEEVGFRRISIVNELRDKEGKLLQVDALFEKKSVSDAS